MAIVYCTSKVIQQRLGCSTGGSIAMFWQDRDTDAGPLLQVQRNNRPSAAKP